MVNFSVVGRNARDERVPYMRHDERCDERIQQLQKIAKETFQTLKQK